MQDKNPYNDKLSRWSSHSLIASMLKGLPEGSRILDVGAASGMLIRFCAEWGYYFRGIEPNPDWANEVRKSYSEWFTGSLEQAQDEFLGGNDAVVCGDVLEHLMHPEEQLHRLVKLQKDNCLIIISVPNGANLWVRLNLLFGRFNYENRGILDRTHLHFYTRQTFIELLRHAKLEIAEIRVTPIPMELISPFFVENRVGRSLFAMLAWLTKMWPTMLGYQWVAKAHKSNSGRN